MEGLAGQLLLLLGPREQKKGEPVEFLAGPRRAGQGRQSRGKRLGRSNLSGGWRATTVVWAASNGQHTGRGLSRSERKTRESKVRTVGESKRKRGRLKRE